MQVLVYRGFGVILGVSVANGAVLYRRGVCNGIATRAGFVQSAHALARAAAPDVEIRARLFEVAVPEHFLHMMQRPARFEQPARAFVPQVMEVQVNRLQRRPRRRCERNWRSQPASSLSRSSQVSVSVPFTLVQTCSPDVVCGGGEGFAARCAQWMNVAHRPGHVISSFGEIKANARSVDPTDLS
jgi:hypothetical protein